MPFQQNNFDNAVKTWRDKGLQIVGDKAEENVSGRVLQTRSGDLLKDVVENEKIEAPNAFSIGTSLVYGKAWEKGFRRKAYTVRPRRAKALRFPISVGAEEFVFALRAEIPAQSFAARPFLKPAVNESRKELVSFLGHAISTTVLFTSRVVEIKIGQK